MRKLISLFLVLAMILSLSVTAFAAETEDRAATANEASDYKASIDVNGKYISRLDSDEIISVDVAWQDMNFIYYGSQEGTWNPTTHTYDGEKTAKWNKTNSVITVTNHSNLEVTANLSYTPSVTSVTGSLNESELTLPSAAVGDSLGDTSKAPNATSTFTIGGTMDSSSATALGTITVSLTNGSGSDGKDDNDNPYDGIEWTVVNTFEELENALDAGGNIKLGKEITSTDSIQTDASFNLDLNGQTLTLDHIRPVGTNARVSIFNGTLVSTNGLVVMVQCEYCEIENCTLIGNGYYALYLSQVGKSDTIVKNTELRGGVFVGKDTTLTATDRVSLTQYEDKLYGSGVCVDAGGTATFNVDPTEILANGYNKGTVKDNGDGTWTVS